MTRLALFLFALVALGLLPPLLRAASPICGVVLGRELLCQPGTIVPAHPHA